jgi:hypothetical protein
MSRPQTHEQRLLYKADQYLSCLAHTHEERLEILEAVAASKSHCDIIEYWKAFDFSCVNVDASVVNNLLQYIEESGIPVSMSISSLAREKNKRKTEYSILISDWQSLLRMTAVIKSA